jgi:hypothetical protein
LIALCVFYKILLLIKKKKGGENEEDKSIKQVGEIHSHGQGELEVEI